MTNQQIRWVLERNSFGRKPVEALPTSGIEVGSIEFNGDIITHPDVISVSNYFRLTKLLTEYRSYPPGLDEMPTYIGDFGL